MLRLPREIKDQIYNYVCGGNTLHIRFTSGGPYTVLCRSELTEQAAQAGFDSSQSRWIDDVSAYHHKDCHSHNNRTLDLRFLRTCHQICDEAKLVYYSSNTFYLSDAPYQDDFDAVEKFVNTADWASNVRSIGLHLNVSTYKRAHTDQVLRGITGKLAGLRCLYLVMEMRYSGGYNKEAEEKSKLTEHILCLGGPFLKVATVVISDAYDRSIFSDLLRALEVDEEPLRHTRWTMAQKQEYSLFLRNALLQHQDNEVDCRRNGAEELLTPGDMKRSMPEQRTYSAWR